MRRALARRREHTPIERFAEGSTDRLLDEEINDHGHPLVGLPSSAVKQLVQEMWTVRQSVTPRSRRLHATLGAERIEG
jgi:hypothetical protein